MSPGWNMDSPLAISGAAPWEIPKIGFYHLDLIGVQFFSGMRAIESQNASGLGVIIADGGTPATGALLAAALLHKRVQFIYGKVLRYAGTG